MDRIPLIWRAMPEMRVERNHWTYSGLDASGRRIGLWGGDALYPLAKTAELQAPHLFMNMLYARDEMRLKRAQAYPKRVAEYVAEHGVEP